MKFLAEQGLTGFIFVFQPNKFDALLLYRSHRINFGVDGWLDKSCDRLKYLGLREMFCCETRWDRQTHDL